MDEHGFLTGREGDGIFTDRSEDMDKYGRLLRSRFLNGMLWNGWDLQIRLQIEFVLIGAVC